MKKITTKHKLLDNPDNYSVMIAGKVVREALDWELS